MILNVRGGLGMQVLETMVGYAKAIERNENVEAIEISTGGNVVDTVKHNFLESVIESNLSIRVTNSTLKQNAWSRENFKLLVKHYDEVRNKISVKDVNVPLSFTIFHVRGKDRQLVSAENYLKILEVFDICSNDFFLLSDDYELAKKIKSQRSSLITFSNSNDPVRDWIMCTKTKSLFGAFSTFTLSAWLMNPEIYYTILGPKYNDKMSLAREYYEMLNILFEGIPGNGNIRFD